MNRQRLWTYVLLVVAFGIAMGYLEAMVVVYIRKILGIVPTPVNLDRSVSEQIPQWLVQCEITREAATIVMLVCFAILAADTLARKVGTFLLVFGVWDIFYYVSLWCLMDWPPSLATIDLLFLIPVPWIAPVWVPLACSATMIAIGLLLLAGRRRAEA